MADNVPITAGSGTSIATDEATDDGSHVQLFKLTQAADGSRSYVPADAQGLVVQSPNLELLRLMSSQLALLKAIHVQLTVLTDHYADPNEFMEHSLP